MRKIALALVIWFLGMSFALAATLLPNGKQQFFDNSGGVNAGGYVYFYIPSTTTLKTTWQDAGMVTANANPVPLDANGRAIIYGNGQYREVVYQADGTLVWDQLTSDTTSLSLLWGGTSTGTGTAFALSVANFNFVAGQTVNFIAGQSNTGATTLNINSTGGLPVYKPTASGLSVLAGGELILGNTYQVALNASANAYDLIGPTFSTWIATQTSLTSATTTDLGTIASHNVVVTGTTTIASFGFSASAGQPWYQVCFSGILTITYNATSMLLPSSADITTAAGDCLVAQYGGVGNWIVTSYQRYSGLPLINPSPVGIGYSQTWQTPSRSINTVYTNSTAVPIQVAVSIALCSNCDAYLQVGGINTGHVYLAGTEATGTIFSMSAIVPPGVTYSATSLAGTLNLWSELR